MNKKALEESGHLTLMEAVDTLSSIADMEFETDVGFINPPNIAIQGEDMPVTDRTVNWLHQQDPKESVELIHGVFKIVLKFLQHFYKEEFRSKQEKRTLEGIKAVMVLVGEAAKKIDRYTALFHSRHLKSITELSEYRQLQDFYLRKISRTIDQGVLGKWILALSRRALEEKQRLELVDRKEIHTRHIFVDLDSVKQDTDYELFFMRKEDGSRFFSPRLIRNIKLVCDFGSTLGRDYIEDPLTDFIIWQDRYYYASATGILHYAQRTLRRFYKVCWKHHEWEFVAKLNNAIMALMLASNPQNLLDRGALKTSQDYFCDFQHFLRRVVHLRDYQKLLAYPPKRGNQLAQTLLDTVHSLTRGLYFQPHGLLELQPYIHDLVEQGLELLPEAHRDETLEKEGIWPSIALDEEAIRTLMKHHANGPLTKVLDVLEQGHFHAYDPLLQHNIPGGLYHIYNQDHRITNLRLPSPVYQEFINKVMVTEEFKSFLLSETRSGLNGRHLMFNLQDRTSWEEHFRAAALEDMQNVDLLKEGLTVVTLAVDTEFYHQEAPYRDDRSAKVFIQHFKEHLEDVHSGFFFPAALKKKLFPKFVNGILGAVHRIFFSKKNVLRIDERKSFIEIFYLFLQFKVLEIENPETFSFTCKDGVDTGQMASVQLFVFLRMMSEEELTPTEVEEIKLLLFAPALLVRERTLLPQRFQRIQRAMRTIETLRNELGYKNFAKLIQEAFGLYFDTPILQALVLKATRH